jgi:hypothetical protein
MVSLPAALPYGPLAPPPRILSASQVPPPFAMASLPPVFPYTPLAPDEQPVIPHFQILPSPQCPAPPGAFGLPQPTPWIPKEVGVPSAQCDCTKDPSGSGRRLVVAFDGTENQFGPQV